MRFLVCLDISDFSRSILPVAKKFATATGAEVEIITVISPARSSGESSGRHPSEPSDAAAEEDARRALAPAVAAFDPPAWITVISARSAAAAIIKHARTTQPDAVLLATHSRGTLGEAVLGSTARDVAHSGVAPVLLIHPVGVSGMRPRDIPLGVYAFSSDGAKLGEVVEVTDERLRIRRTGLDDLCLPVGVALAITAGYLALDAAEADIERLAIEVSE